MSKLVVRRHKAWWADLLRNYLILVDGREVQRIKNGETVELSLAPGEHRVQVAIDWGRSLEVEITVKPDQQITLECGPNANPLTALIYLSLLPNRYLWLRLAGREF